MTAEQIAVGCALAAPDESIPYLTQAGITRDVFESANLANLFQFIVTSWLDRKPGGAQAIALALGDDLPKHGGAGELYELSLKAPPPVSLPHYAEKIKSAHAKRRLAACLTASLEALSASSAEEIIASVEAEIGNIAAARHSERIVPTKQIVTNVIANIEARTDGRIAGLSTGIPSLDAETGGIRVGGYWVIAGPTKGGKSALARLLVRSVAIDQRKPVLVFGLEMSNEDTVEALMATTGKISASRMRDGQMNEQDYQRIAAAAGSIASAPIYFRDDVYDLASIRAYTRQIKASVPDLAVVVVDYLQLTEGAGNLDRRELEIATVSKALRRMAKDENVAVIALAQVNDDGLLRECRAIGMDATVQVTIELTDKPGVRHLRLRQRQGKTGIHVPVAFLGDTFEFHPLEESEPDESPKKKQHWKNRHQ